MVSSLGIFVNNWQIWIFGQISSAKTNESATVYSLAVEGFKNFSKNFANLLAGVPIAERLGRKNGSHLRVFLWILTNSYKMFGLEPTFTV